MQSDNNVKAKLYDDGVRRTEYKERESDVDSPEWCIRKEKIRIWCKATSWKEPWEQALLRTLFSGWH